MAARKKAAPKRELVAVKYVGTADIKEFLGLFWDQSNNHTIPAKDIDADVLANLRSQPDFRFVYE